MPAAPVSDRAAAPSLLPALGAALPAAVAIVGAVGISLSASQAVGLSDRATASWLLVQFGLPAQAIDAVSGVATAAAAMGLGAVPVSLAGFVTPLIAGPEAGDVRGRYRAGYASGAVMIAVAVAAPMAAEVPAMVPPALLAGLVGLAMLGVLGQALSEVGRTRAHLGPLVAFAAAASGLELLGLGPIFWALVLGVVTAFVLDRRSAT